MTRQQTEQTTRYRVDFRFFTVEGFEHRERIVEATSPEEAARIAGYSETYDRSLTVTRLDEEPALTCHARPKQSGEDAYLDRAERMIAKSENSFEDEDWEGNF